MRILIFVRAPIWRGNNPVILKVRPEDLDTEEKLEAYARGWASVFPADIVMMLEEDE